MDRRARRRRRRAVLRASWSIWTCIAGHWPLGGLFPTLHNSSGIVSRRRWNRVGLHSITGHLSSARICSCRLTTDSSCWETSTSRSRSALTPSLLSPSGCLMPLWVIPVSECYRLLAKIQLTESGRGCHPGMLRNYLADELCGTDPVHVRIPDYVSRAAAALNQYQVYCRFILLDTVTGYRSQYHKESFLIVCVERSIDPRPECNWYSCYLPLLSPRFPSQSNH